MSTISVKLLKDYGSAKKGEIISVKNNEAHALIEQKIATLNYQDKLMRPRVYKKTILRTKDWR
jgi:hypothetical protein